MRVPSGQPAVLPLPALSFTPPALRTTPCSGLLLTRPVAELARVGPAGALEHWRQGAWEAAAEPLQDLKTFTIDLWLALPGNYYYNCTATPPPCRRMAGWLAGLTVDCGWAALRSGAVERE